MQDEFAFYIALGLPVYVGINLPGTDADLLAVGRDLAGQSCAAPFDTGAAEWQIAGRKIWNWGEKNLHIRDEKVLAAELLKEPELNSLSPLARFAASEDRCRRSLVHDGIALVLTVEFCSHRHRRLSTRKS